jgi:sulfur-carrier protein
MTLSFQDGPCCVQAEAGTVPAMVSVELTPHLFTFFPDLKGKRLSVDASDVAQVVRELDKLAPGIGFYICDERGGLRTHVNIFVGEERVNDRRHLTDPVKAGSRVFIMQALSGG